MPKHVRIFGVPMDLGQRRRGVDMGPSAIRYAGLHSQLRALGYSLTDSGNLSVPLPENEPPDDSRARHLHSIAGVCWDIYQQALVCNESGETPIFLGGDHSLSIGTVAAITASEPDVGVLWVDAHGDFNTPEITPSGNVHGMALATLMGWGRRSSPASGGRAPSSNRPRPSSLARAMWTRWSASPCATPACWC